VQGSPNGRMNYNPGAFAGRIRRAAAVSRYLKKLEEDSFLKPGGTAHKFGVPAFIAGAFFVWKRGVAAIMIELADSLFFLHISSFFLYQCYCFVVYAPSKACELAT
jgi:hypothetical protein